MKKGKLIVIDGIDGVGKATQTGLLVARLKKMKVKVKRIDFPRYYDNVFGKLIGECLAGKYGEFIRLHPKIVSVLFAADRFESKQQIETWLKKGYTVIADRYVSSNQIHQGGKIKNPKEKKEFLKWLDTIEHKVFGLPRPDAIIYLDLPVAMSMELLKQKTVHRKRYLEGKRDLAENDIKHLESSRKHALSIVQKANHWIKIECSKDGKILPRGYIHELVLKEVKMMLRR